MSLRRTLACVCAWKAFLLLLPLGLWGLAPQSFQSDLHLGHFPGSDATSLAARYSTWDAQHYLRLVEHGYREGEPSAWMYPLFPALIRAAAPLGSPIAIGLALSHLCFLGACVLLYREVARRHGARAAAAAVFALTAYPGSFFFGLVYTEALFLALSLALFSCVERGRWGWAAAAGFALPLARAVGVLAVLPLAWTLWERRSERGAAAALALVAGAVVAGWAAYFGWIYLATGNALAGIEAGALFVSQPSFEKLVDPAGFIAELCTVTGLMAYRGGLMDRALFVAYLAFLVPIGRCCTRAELLWSLALGLSAAAAVSLMSFTRHTILVYPIFIVIGLYLARPDKARFAALAGGTCLLLQTVLCALHVSSYWVG